MNKKYIDFELQNGEFPKCKKCGLEGFFTDEFGIVNEKIYCIKCIEANNLQDQGKLESEKNRKELKPLIAKHHKIIAEKYLFQPLYLKDWDDSKHTYSYYTNLAINELSFLKALREFEISKKYKKEHRLDLVILKFEKFLYKLTKVAIADIENYYLINVPRYL